MSKLTDTSDREIVSTRVLAVPRERVFDAFCNPADLAQWWGPKGFTNRIEVFEPRMGGDWRLVMVSPDGTEYHNEAKFTEVVRPERIVFEHLQPMHHFRMTMTFTDHHGMTELTWRMLFDTAEEVTKLGEWIAAANEENFDRLSVLLALNTAA